MEDNTIFLAKASQLFIENGAKTLTMDDVAKVFSISKKTIYVKYKNKEELRKEVLRFKLDEIIARLKYLHHTIENAIERMSLKINLFSGIFYRYNSTDFYIYLGRHFRLPLPLFCLRRFVNR